MEHFNKTTNETTTDLTKTSEKHRLIIDGIASILLSVSLYLITCLSIYEYRTRRRSNQIRPDHHGPVREDNRILMRSISLFTSLLIVMIISLELIELKYDKRPQVYICTSIKITRNVLYGTALTLTFSILWLRQRTFYKSASVKHLTNAFMRFLSKYSIAFTLVSGISATLFVVTTRLYRGSDRGCVRITPSMSNLPGILILVVTGIYHGLFILLTIFPLIKHSKVTGYVTSAQLEVYIDIIRKCCVCTVVPVAWSTISCLFAFFFLTGTYSNYVQVVYDFDLILLYTCVVYSFLDWRVVLAFWRKLRRVNRSSQSVRTITSKVSKHSEAGMELTESP